MVLGFFSLLGSVQGVMDDTAVHRVSQGTRASSARDSFLLQTFGQLKLSVTPENGLLIIH
ncbi:hypothetical protein JZ751_001233, partial [Albula glossodonta]